MTKQLTILMLALLSFTMHAQFDSSAPWMKELQQKKSLTGENSYSFKEITNAFDTYWETRDKTKKSVGYKPFMRWRTHWEQALKQDGTLPTKQDIWTAFNQKQTLPSASSISWTSMGPYDHTNTKSWSPGQGRVNVAVVDPNNPNVFYVGTPAGGIWKSTDAGANWTPLTDKLPQIGVSGIAIDPNNSNIIYISTGDDDSSDTFSAGVFKSIDGGQNWQQTGLSFDTENRVTAGDIFINPENSKIIWVATSDGIYRSLDAGSTWERKLVGQARELRLHPTNPNIIYTVSNDEFFKSEDGGENFFAIGGEIASGNGRMVIAVTPAAPDNVYVLICANGKYYGVFKSIDMGSNFIALNTDESVFSDERQANYDLAITVSDTNPDIILMGQVNIWKSVDGGADFKKWNYWNRPEDINYTHADIHYLQYNNGKILCGSDGGFYTSDDDGVTFTSYTKGLQIGQFYKIAVPQSDSSDKVIGGLQDNGGYVLSDSGWNVYHGADGMGCAIADDLYNPGKKTYYSFIQYGRKLHRTEDRGVTRMWSYGIPEEGLWVTPLASNKEGEIYAAGQYLYKLNDNKTLEKVSDFTLDGWFSNLKVDPNNSKVLFASTYDKLYKTEDKGLTWTKIFTFDKAISDIDISIDNSNIIYVTTNGWGGKVYQSTNQGNNFSDITSNLPNEAKLTVRYHKTTGDVYVGTFLGVYVKEANSTNWEAYSNNLPNVPVKDIEINIKEQVIVAGTYGRGVWKAPLLNSVTDNESPSTPQNLNVDIAKSTSVELSFNATDNIGVSHYKVITTLNEEQVNVRVKYFKNTVVVEGLDPEQTYAFKVSAVDYYGNESSFSNAVFATTTSDTEAPTVPENFNAFGESQDSIYLYWSESTDNVEVTEYEIVVYKQGLEISNYTENIYNSNAKISGLETNTEYQFKIRALDAKGNASEYTELVSAKTFPVMCSVLESKYPIKNYFEIIMRSWSVISEDGVTWRLEDGPTPSSGTGPNEASEGSTYLLAKAVENQSAYPNKVAHYESPCLDLVNSINEKPVITFDYHMYGSEDTGSLALQVKRPNGDWEQLWVEQGDKGDQWNSVNLNLEAYEGDIVKLRFTRVTGNNTLVDVAIDRVKIMYVNNNACKAQTLEYPYVESFENTTGLWSQNANDNGDWLLNQGSTSSSSTGPDAASEGNYYAYIEASTYSTGYPNKIAILESPCFYLEDSYNYNPSLIFDYHMYGKDMGSLAVELSEDNGANWLEIWKYSGELGGKWMIGETINLDAYRDKTIRLRFVGQTGNGFMSDIAIDNVRFVGGEEKDTTPPTTPIRLIAENITQTTFELKWTYSKDESGIMNYDVYQDDNFLAKAYGEFINIESLTPNTSYTFKVRARDNNKNVSEFSEPLVVKTLKIEDQEPPTAPTNLRANDVTKNSLELTWTASSDNVGVVRYAVYKNNEYLKIVTDTTATIEGLMPSTNYAFKVSAEDENNNLSEFSEVLNVVTLGNTTSCTSEVSMYPYNQSFENTYGLWQQSTNDDTDWTGYSGSTPSGNTGPNSASNGDYYLYVEATSNFNKTAIITSPCFEIDSSISTPKFNFDYHMYGSYMGALNLEISTDDSQTWSSLWQVSGDEGNSWNTQQVALDDYIGGNIRLRFVGQTGNNYTSDIAIDNVSLTSSISNEDTTAPTTPLNLAASNTTETTTNLSWGASTDNVSVIGYDVYMNNSLYTTVVNTETNITDLTQSSSYQFKVQAKDAAGNLSEFSNIVVVDTLGDSSDICNGVDDYDSNKSYRIGDRVVSNNYLYEKISYSYYGSWKKIGPCTTNNFYGRVSTLSKNNELAVVPNPLKNNVLKIEYSAGLDSSYSIYNIIGQEVKSGVFTNTIDVKNLQDGTYILKVMSNNEIHSVRFVK